MKHVSTDYISWHLHRPGKIKAEPPWWTRREYFHSWREVNQFYAKGVYTRHNNEIAVVEWRSGTAYLVLLMIGDKVVQLVEPQVWENEGPKKTTRLR